MNKTSPKNIDEVYFSSLNYFYASMNFYQILYLKIKVVTTLLLFTASNLLLDIHLKIKVVTTYKLESIEIQ